jgi:hypothetical protein
VIVHSEPTKNRLCSDFINPDNVKRQNKSIICRKTTHSTSGFVSVQRHYSWWLLAISEPYFCLFNDAANITDCIASNGKDDY